MTASPECATMVAEALIIREGVRAVRNDYQTEVRAFYRKNPEIRQLLKQRRTIFLLKLVLLEAVVLFVSHEIWEYGLPVHAVIIGVIAAAVLPLFVLKPFRTVGNGWCGEIIGYKEELRRDFQKGIVMHGSSAVRKYMTCIVMGDDGKKHRFRVRALYDKVYRRGGRVLYVRGLQYPIPLTPEKHTVCLFCGARMLTSVDHCAGCGAKRLYV